MSCAHGVDDGADSTHYVARGVHAGPPVPFATQRTSSVRKDLTYNADGQVTVEKIASTDTLNDYVVSSYYADGQPHSSATKADLAETGLITAYGYDPNGNTNRVWSPSAIAPGADNNDGIPSIHEFTFDNLLAATIDPIAADGSKRRRTSFTYDPAGRKVSESVTRVTGAGNFTTPDPTLAADEIVGDRTWTYSPNGLVLTTVGRGGVGTISNSYKANGQLAAVSDGTGKTVTSGYYLNGWLRQTQSNRSANVWNRQVFRYYGDGKEIGRVNYEKVATAALPNEYLTGYQFATFNDARLFTAGGAVLSGPVVLKRQRSRGRRRTSPTDAS